MNTNSGIADNTFEGIAASNAIENRISVENFEKIGVEDTENVEPKEVSV